MSQRELIKQCFAYINSYKRHRALALIARQEGRMADAQFNELKKYQYIDALELGLRALQRTIYDREDKKEEEKEEYNGSKID